MTAERSIRPMWVLVTVAVVTAALVTWVAFVGTSSSDRDRPHVPLGSWAEVMAEARGQTVRFWMWGGEVALNQYIDEQVAPAAAEREVTLVRVPIEDTADALARMAAEIDAGTAQGSIDLVWVNGVNFAQGREAGLWLDAWTSVLPTFELLDPGDATLSTDFGVPVDGQELPWGRGAFVFAYDSARLVDPPRTFAELADYIRRNPGRVTYPAPPDFTGAAFVRQAVQALGEDEAFNMLGRLQPLLWEGGSIHPRDQAELDRLFAAGVIDLAMSYNPNFVEAAVRSGRFPGSVRPYVFDDGSLQNVSFVAIPSNAASAAGAMVVADLLLQPEMQAAKLEHVGIPTVLDLSRLTDNARSAFASTSSPYRLDDFGLPILELPVDEVSRINRRWLDEVGR